VRSQGSPGATPSMHRVHHSPEIRGTNTNYGTVFGFWDRLFGTHSRPVHPRPERDGLACLEGDSWQSMAGVLLTPLRAWRLGTL